MEPSRLSGPTYAPRSKNFLGVNFRNLMAIAIDRNAPVISMQISSEWKNFIAGEILPFELKVAYSTADQSVVLENGNLK